MKKVLICAQKGGVWKSGLADQLAYSMDDTDTPYCFYNLDSQGDDLHADMEQSNAALAIIDTPGYITNDLPEMIADADIIVLPTRASVGDMPPFERMRDMISTYAPNTPVIVVLAAWTRWLNGKAYAQWLLDTKRSNETLVCIPQSEAVPRSAEANKSVIHYAPKTQIAAQVRKYTNAVRLNAGLPLEPEIDYQKKTRGNMQ